MTGYYRKFIRGYGFIAKPLTTLLQKGNIGWNENAEAAFQNLKEALTSTSILALPDFNKPFEIEN